jgi:hypothetical protein
LDARTTLKIFIASFNLILQIPIIPNVSLVAFYGTKLPGFQYFLETLQQQISEMLQDEYERYELEQIHATLIGCEGLKTSQEILSKWFLENRREEKYLNLTDFIDFVRSSDRLPLALQLGGYNLATDYHFLSQEKHPFYRSFQFIGNIAVLRGWAVKNKQITLDVDRFRLACQQYNLLHKYHLHSHSVDNDIYLRVGVLKREISQDIIAEVEREIQNQLSQHLSLLLTLDRDRLNFIQYQNLSPSPDTTTVISLQQATKETIENLYPTR